MSSRDCFWFLAGVLVAVAVMVAVRAVLRERPALDEAISEGGARRPTLPAFALPVAAGLALVGVALGIYFLLGSPDSIASANASSREQPTHDTRESQQPSPAAGSLNDVTNKLAARLAAQGGSDNDWQLLAESYEYMGRAADAKAARAHIASAAAQEAGSISEGAARASGDPIADIADALDQPQPAKGGDPAAARAATGSGTATAALASHGGGNAQISGTVEITSRLARQAQPGATLFIYAKQSNAPGPPLAVLRVNAEHWPVRFTLNDGNSMVPGRNLSNANSVQIEARISKNGDALPHSGDLVGSVTSVNPRDGHPVKISIDRQIG